MRWASSSDERSYRKEFFDAAVGLRNGLKYLVFVYLVGSAVAVIALAQSQSTAAPGFSLAHVLMGYGLAALALAIFLYAFVKLMILACCAYGEWLVEEPGPTAESHADESATEGESEAESGSEKTS